MIVRQPSGAEVEEASALYIVAEVSIGLAGFTGVIAALQGRDGWHPIDVWRVVALLCITFSALFLALIPVGLHAAGLSDSSVWRISGGLGVAAIVVGYIIIKRYEPPDGMAQQGAYNLAGSALGVILLLLHILTTVLAAFWPFFFALLTILLLSSFQFSNILLLRPNR